jgi:transposase
MQDSITDIVWVKIAPLIPVKATKVGRPRSNPRKVLKAIMFIIRTGMQWRYLPREYGASTTIHGIYMQWCRTGVCGAIFEVAKMAYCSLQGVSNWYAIDTSSKKAPLALSSGKNPTDRAKRDIKQIVIVDRKGAPVAVGVAAANVHDSKLLEPMLKNYFPTKDPYILASDSAWDAEKLRKICAKKNSALIAATNRRRNKNTNKVTPSMRWLVERTIGWFSWQRGLKICWVKLPIVYLGFLHLAAASQLFKMSGIFG